METITFYSYKGGVGRTLALANIAMYLRRFGLNVCLLDFDLEAPGLHYKFIQNPKPDDIKSGLLDYIYEFTQKRDMPEDFVPYSIEIFPQTKIYGSIRLIPAGNVLFKEYWKKLASIDWYSMFYREDSEGVPFFLELKERIEIEFNPDVLLIDSRTGVTEMGGVCTALLPDKVVFFITNNQENIDGARQIIKGIKKVDRLPGQNPIEVILALTRIPSGKTFRIKNRENEIITNLLNNLNEGITDINKLTVQDICILHSDRELELSESLKLGVKSISATDLAGEYIEFFSKVLTGETSTKICKILNDKLKGSLNRTKHIVEYMDQIIEREKSLENMVIRHIAAISSFSNIADTADEELNNLLIKEKNLLIKLIEKGAKLELILTFPTIPKFVISKKIIKVRLKELLDFLNKWGFNDRCNFALYEQPALNLLFFGDNILFEGQAAYSKGWEYTFVYTNRDYVGNRIEDFDNLFEDACKDTIEKYPDLEHPGSLRHAVIHAVKTAITGKSR